MPINEKLIIQEAAASTGDADAAQGLVLHLDANDEDSIEAGGANQGDGSGTWFDIANHDLVTPLADKASNLQLHLNASDTTSYSGSGSTWTDISSNGRNGTITDPVFESNLEGALDFNSASGTSGDKVEVTHNTIFNQSTSITFEFWINRDSTAEGNIMYKGSAGGNSYYLTYNTANGYQYNNYASGGGIYSGTGGLNTGVFEHVVLTIDSSGNKLLYVNGTASSNTLTGSVATTNLTDTANLFFGGYYPYAAHTGLNGKIGIVRIYNTTLTASEVAQNFRAGNTFSYSSIYSTNLAIHLDAADASTVSSTTWSDKANSNNATIGSSVGFSGTLSDYYDKELGNWLVLDGSDDNMTISSNSSFQNATAFSLEMWIQPISIAADEMLSTLYTSGSDFKWDLRFDTGGVLRWIVGTSSGASHSNQDLTTTDTLSTGTWYHIVATYDDSADTMKIYIDGLQSASESTPNQGTRTGGSDDIDIGHRIGSYEANIKIGQYRLYNTSLTAAQVAQNYLATKNDYPNGNHATNNGATFSATTPAYFDFVSNDYFRTPSIPITWTSGFAYEIYFQADTNTQSYPISTSGSTNPSLSWRNFSGYKLVAFHYRSSSSVDYLLSDATSTGQWYHIVYTANDSGGQIYTNGSLSDSSSNSVRTGDYNDYFDIGRLGGGNYLDGKIGMVKIYAKHLSSSEVTAKYEATKDTFGL